MLHFSLIFLLLAVSPFSHDTIYLHAPIDECQPMHQSIGMGGEPGKYISWKQVFGPIWLLKKQSHQRLLQFSVIASLFALLHGLMKEREGIPTSLLHGVNTILAVASVVVVWICLVVPMIWIYRILDQII